MISGMARRTIVQLSSDLDGSEADQKVTFGLDRGEYEIDLTDEQAAELRAVFAPFVAAARRSRSSRQAATGTKEDSATVREWARRNGIEVNARGRVAAAVLEAYRSR
jgi:hypothetical protein